MARTQERAAESEHSPVRQRKVRERPARVRRGLIASFAAVAITFTLGLGLTNTFIGRIHRAAAEITENSSPSISYLSSMRSAMRQLQVAVAAHVAACGTAGCGAPPARLRQLDEELQASWQRYRLLPAFPGEPDRWPALESDLHRAGELVALTLEAAGAGRTREATERLREQLPPAFDRLDAGIAHLIEADDAQGLVVAARIEHLAQLSTRATVALDLVMIALTALAATLAVRLVHRYERSQRERAEDLDQFAARVAHDVKGPLTSTAAALHVARKLASEPGRAALERGEHGVRRVQRLVDDLLEFARAGVLDARSAVTDLRDVVEEVVGDLGEIAAEHRVDVRVESVAHERIACSRGVLTSIVMNLVRNAILHMGESPVRVVRVRASPVADDGWVRIEVEDSGPGIPDALRGKLFQPFVRGPDAAVEGSGLGLATVKRFVGAHGGSVGFAAHEGRGTLFWLELPRSA